MLATIHEYSVLRAKVLYKPHSYGEKSSKKWKRAALEVETLASPISSEGELEYQADGEVICR